MAARGAQEVGRRLVRALLAAAAAGACLLAGNCFSLQLARETSCVVDASGHAGRKASALAALLSASAAGAGRRQLQVQRRGTRWDVYGAGLRQGVKHVTYTAGQFGEEKVRVLVNSISHETTEDQLLEHFEDLGAVLAKKTTPTAAVVEFPSDADARHVVQQAHRTVLDGRLITVRFDDRVGQSGGREHVTMGVPAKTVKVLVEGFSGSVTKEDIYKYFSRVGSIAQVRFLDIDVCLLYYRTQEEADEAVRLFDKTIITGDVTGVDVRLAPQGGPDGILDRATAAIRRRREQGGPDRPDEFKDMSEKQYADYIRERHARTVHVHGPSEGFDEGTTADIVEEHFSTVGMPTEVFRSARNRFVVQFSTPEEAEAAVEAYDCTVLDGNSDIIRCKLYGDEHDFPVIGSVPLRRLPAWQEREALERDGALNAKLTKILEPPPESKWDKFVGPIDKRRSSWALDYDDEVP